jgi:fructokinase
MKHQTGSRPIIYGEVLFDCFPDDRRVLGGAPFNVAWNLQAFGMNPLFISRVGDDAMGAEIRAAMRNWGMDLAGLQTDPDHPTGIVQIQLESGEPSFDILPERAYDYIDSQSLPALDKASMIYHGSLILRTPVSATTFESLRNDRALPAFLDVNLRSPWWNYETVHASMKRSRWIKLNENELNTLIAGDYPLSRKIQELQNSTGAELVIITRGERGTIAYTAVGQTEEVAPGDVVTIIDTVGAGDAFASVMITGLLQDWPLSLSLVRAQAFASAIVGQRGATSQEPGFYQPFIENWGLA